MVVEVDFEEVACLVRDDAYEVRVDVTPSERGEVGEAQPGEAGEEESLAEEVLCRGSCTAWMRCNSSGVR